MRGDEFEGACVARVVDEIEVGFVHDDQCGGRHGLHERGEFIAGDDGAGGIVGIADIDDARFRGAGRGHFRKVVAMVGGERDQDGSWSCSTRAYSSTASKVGAAATTFRAGSRKAASAARQNFRGAAAENDIFGFHLVFLREHVRELAISSVGIAIGDAGRNRRVRRGLWARGRRDSR